MLWVLPAHLMHTHKKKPQKTIVSNLPLQVITVSHLKLQVITVTHLKLPDLKPR